MSSFEAKSTSVRSASLDKIVSPKRSQSSSRSAPVICTRRIREGSTNSGCRRLCSSVAEFHYFRGRASFQPVTIGLRGYGFAGALWSFRLRAGGAAPRLFPAGRENRHRIGRGSACAPTIYWRGTSKPCTAVDLPRGDRELSQGADTRGG
jgi:hypothetical protein